MKRTSSMSRIPMRNSRSTIKTPVRSDIRPRSLSRSSHLLPPVTSYGPYRARSSSSTRESATPLGKRSILCTPGSASSSKDNRPISDKQWQQSEWSKKFDDRIDITMENFKTDVVLHLKTFRYPGQVKPSLMQTVNVPSNWPQILAIWSWLIDRIELLEDPTRVLYPPGVNFDKLKLYNITHEYIKNKFKLWCEYNDESIADQKFQEEMVRYWKIDVNAKNELSTQVSNLEGQVNSLEEKQKDLTSKNQELAEKISKIETENNEYLKRQKEDHENLNLQKSQKMARLKKVEELINAKKTNIESLKAKIGQQSCSYKEKVELVKRLNELKHSRRLKEERIEERRELISIHDYKLAELKKMIESKVYSINNKISTLSLQRPELEGLKIRDTGFARRDMIQELDHHSKQRNEFVDKCTKELAELQLKLNVNLSSQKQEILKMEKLDAELASLHDKKSKLEGQIAKEKVKNEQEIKAMTLKREELITQLSDMVSQRVSLKDLKEQLKASEEMAESLKERLFNLMSKSKEFMIDECNSTLNNDAKQTKISNDLSIKISSALAASVAMYERMLKENEGELLDSKNVN